MKVVVYCSPGSIVYQNGKTINKESNIKFEYTEYCQYYDLNNYNDFILLECNNSFIYRLFSNLISFFSIAYFPIDLIKILQKKHKKNKKICNFFFCPLFKYGGRLIIKPLKCSENTIISVILLKSGVPFMVEVENGLIEILFNNRDNKKQINKTLKQIRNSEIDYSKKESIDSIDIKEIINRDTFTYFFKFNKSFFTPYIIILVIGIILFLVSTALIKEIKILIYILYSMLLLLCLIPLIKSIISYKKIKKLIKNSKINYVEGNICDFVSSEDSFYLDNIEKFKVNNVIFEYTNDEIYGYCNFKNKNGLFRKNGQYVKIIYCIDPLNSSRNVILYAK